jgi:hypothetical protein
VAYHEVRREALTGVRVGQPLSREIKILQGADAFTPAEGITDGNRAGEQGNEYGDQRSRELCPFWLCFS